MYPVKLANTRMSTSYVQKPPRSLVHPMIGENRQLVTDEPVELRNNRLKFKTGGKLPIILEEFLEYTPIL